MGSVLFPSGGTSKMHRTILLQVFVATLITAELPPDHQFFEGLTRLECNKTTDRAFGWFEYEETECNYTIKPDVPIKLSCKTFNIPQADDGSCPNVMKFEEDEEVFQMCGNHYPSRVFSNGVTIAVVTTGEVGEKLTEKKDKDGKSKGEKGRKSKLKRSGNDNGGGRVRSGQKLRRVSRSLPEERKQPPVPKGIKPGGPARRAGRSSRTRGVQERIKRRREGRKPGPRTRGLERSQEGKQRKKNDKKDKNDKQSNGFGYHCVWQPEYPYSYFYNYYYYFPWDDDYYYNYDDYEDRK